MANRHVVITTLLSIPGSKFARKKLISAVAMDTLEKMLRPVMSRYVHVVFSSRGFALFSMHIYPSFEQFLMEIQSLNFMFLHFPRFLKTGLNKI